MRALVLSGGGSKGAYQLGVLKRWLLEEGRDYEILAGISVGALNTSVLCQAPLGDPHLAYQKLESLWDRVENRRVRKLWFLGYLAALWKPSLYDSSPLEKWVRTELDVKAVQASGRQLRVGAVNWDTGDYQAVTQNTLNLPDWVLASASFPGFFKPIQISGFEWTDGGVKNVTPLGDAIRAGATEIDVIMTGNPYKPNLWHPERKVLGFRLKGRSVLWRALRAVDLALDEIVLGDLKEAGLKNDLAKLGGPYKNVKIRTLWPSRSLGTQPLDFNPENIRRMREIGYKDAVQSG